MQAIASGIAALLRGVYPEGEGHVSATFKEAPTPPTLQVVGVERFVWDGFGDGGEFTFLVEAYLGLISERKAHERLYELLSSNGVPEAVESDVRTRAGVGEANGCLFSRLNEDGTVTTDSEDPAADSISFIEYRGATRVERGAQSALTGIFAFKVVT